MFCRKLLRSGRKADLVYRLLQFTDSESPAVEARNRRVFVEFGYINFLKSVENPEDVQDLDEEDELYTQVKGIF